MTEAEKRGKLPTNAELAEYAIKCLFGNEKQFDRFFARSEIGAKWLGNTDIEAFKQDAKELIKAINKMDEADRENAKGALRNFFEICSIGSYGMKRFREGVEQLPEKVTAAALGKHFGYPKSFREAVAPDRKAAEEKEAAQPVPRIVNVNLDVYGQPRKQLIVENFNYAEQLARTRPQPVLSGEGMNAAKVNDAIDKMQMTVLSLDSDAIKKFSAATQSIGKMALAESTWEIVVSPLFGRKNLKITSLGQLLEQENFAAQNFITASAELRKMAEGKNPNPAEISKKLGEVAESYATFMSLRVAFEQNVERYNIDTMPEYFHAGLMKSLDVFTIVATVTGVGGLAAAGRAGTMAALKEIGAKKALMQLGAGAFRTSAAFTALTLMTDVGESAMLNELAIKLSTKPSQGIMELKNTLAALEGMSGPSSGEQIKKQIGKLEGLEKYLQEGGQSFDPAQISMRAGEVFLWTFAFCMVFGAGEKLRRAATIAKTGGAGESSYAAPKTTDLILTPEGRYTLKTEAGKELVFEARGKNGRDLHLVTDGKASPDRSFTLSSSKQVAYAEGSNAKFNVAKPVKIETLAPKTAGTYTLKVGNGPAIEYIADNSNPWTLRAKNWRSVTGVAEPGSLTLGKPAGETTYALGDNGKWFTVTQLPGERAFRLEPVKTPLKGVAKTALEEKEIALKQEMSAQVGGRMKESGNIQTRRKPGESVDELAVKTAEEWLRTDNDKLADKLKLGISRNRNSIMGYGEQPKLPEKILRMCEVSELPEGYGHENAWRIRLERNVTDRERALNNILDAVQTSRSKLEITP